MPQGPEWEPEKEKTKTDTTFVDAEAPELSKGLARRNATYKTVKETGEKCRIVRPISDIEAEVEWAPQKWDIIRHCTNDIEKIARNTGLPTKEIEQIKDHLFYRKHILDKGVLQFNPDSEIAAAWDRLYRGDFIKDDLKLLEHEYYESIVETNSKVSYRDAHSAAERAGKIWLAPKF